jgi:hypothetical protein
VFSCLYCYLFLDVYMFCDVCLVGLSSTVGIFSPPSLPFLPPTPFHPYSLFPFNSLMGLFLFVLFHITCPAPFGLVSTPGICLVPSRCPAWVCPGAASCERCLCLVDLYSCYFWTSYTFVSRGKMEGFLN